MSNKFGIKGGTYRMGTMEHELQKYNKLKAEFEKRDAERMRKNAERWAQEKR